MMYFKELLPQLWKLASIKTVDLGRADVTVSLKASISRIPSCSMWGMGFTHSSLLIKAVTISRQLQKHPDWCSSKYCVLDPARLTHNIH